MGHKTETSAYGETEYGEGEYGESIETRAFFGRRASVVGETEFSVSVVGESGSSE